MTQDDNLPLIGKSKDDFISHNINENQIHEGTDNSAYIFGNVDGDGEYNEKVKNQSNFYNHEATYHHIDLQTTNQQVINHQQHPMNNFQDSNTERNTEKLSDVQIEMDLSSEATHNSATKLLGTREDDRSNTDLMDPTNFASTSSVQDSNVSLEKPTQNKKSPREPIARRVSNTSVDTLKSNSVKPKVTPLPWAHISIVFIMFTTDVLALTSLTPYLPFLVESFGIVKERWMLGYIAGFIASSYYFAQFFSSFFWGTLSDKLGRRPVLLFGLFSSCIATLAFGFSKSLIWALTCRLLYGAFNGNLGVMKTFLAEMTDKTNQGKAFSYIGLSFGIGQIVGPIIGGYLAQPVEGFPTLFSPNSPFRIFKEFLELFPFFLPNFLIFVTTLIATVIGLFFLKESNRDLLKKKGLVRSTSSIELLDTTITEADVDTMDGTNVEDGNREDTHLKVSNVDVKKESTPTVEKKSFWNRLRSSEIIASPAPLLTVLIYTGFGINSVLYSEILPLWAILSPKRWGISFTANDLGLTFTISGIMIFIINLFVVHRLIDRFGLLTTLRVGSYISVPTIIFFPEVSYFFYPKPVMSLVWISLMILNLIRQITSQLQFTSIMIMINNSVTYKNMGSLNGISQSAVAASRAVGPTMGGVLFAMSITTNFFPFDVHLVFIIMALINLLCLLLSYLLPNSICEPKDSDDEGKGGIHKIMME